jgi:hypothetical protein
MEGNDTTWPDKLDHLRNELLWFWHVDEDQARRREVERSRGKTCVASIGMKDCDIRQATVRGELLSPLHLLLTPFYTNYPACGADALGEKIKTTPRATADLDDAPTVTNADVVKQPC